MAAFIIFVKTQEFDIIFTIRAYKVKFLEVRLMVIWLVNILIKLEFPEKFLIFPRTIIFLYSKD